MPSSSDRPVIAIDMDHVMADTGAYLTDWVNDQFGKRFESESFGTLRSLLSGTERAALMDLVTEGSVLGELPVMDGAVEVIRALGERYTVVVATAAMEYPNTIPHKLRWLDAHFPFLDPQHFVFCGRKQVLSCDYLLDDSPKHFDGLPGQGVLYTAPHNHDVRGYDRVSDWDAVRRYFLEER